MLKSYNINYYRNSTSGGKTAVTEGDNINNTNDKAYYRFSLQNNHKEPTNQNRPFNCPSSHYMKKNSFQNKIEGRGFFRTQTQKNDKKYSISHKLDKSEPKNNGTYKHSNNELVLDQLSQLVEKKKKSYNNTISFSKRNNIRNPFKFTQITSIKEQSFQKSENVKNPFTSEIITHEYIPIGLSVKEFAYHENKNALNRKEMQDFHKIIDKFQNDSTRGYFSLFDGHGGGTEPIKYARDRLPEIFSKFLKETNHNVEKSIIYSLQKLDDELKIYSEIENCGSTVTIIYTYKEYDTYQSNKQIIYCANLGDSKSILITNEQEKEKRYKVLTSEHKCNNESEAKRIRDAGGIVFNGRLFGQLILSRALGDFSMKSHGLISTPSIHKHIVNEKDKFIIIASDGVWDQISEDEIVDICLENGNCDNIGEKIVNLAINKGSTDNISCIAIKIG